TMSLSASDFNIRITAQINDDDHKFGIDNVIVKVENDAEEETPATPADTTPPVITIPDDITGTPRIASLGYYAEFTVTATDDVDGAVDVTCSHSSGYFQVGITTVTCSATDDAGNTANASFTITVTSSTPTDSDGDGYHDGIDQCPNEASSSNYGCPDTTNPVNGTTPEANLTSIYGGQRHTYTYEHLVNGQPEMYRGFVGTIGFAGTNTDGQIGFIGAGHTFTPKINPGGTPHIVQKHFHIYDNITVSNVTAVSPFGKHDSSNYNLDAGWVPLDTTKAQITNQIKRLDGQIWNMTQGNSTDVQRGAKINLSGAETNSNGVLLFKNATITTYNHKIELVTMEGHYLGNYNSVGGDSGAPVTINATNSTSPPSVKLIGIHTGTICRYSSPSEGNSEVNVYSIFNGTDPRGQILNGSQVCGEHAQRLAPLPNSNISSLSWYYKAIVPWELIKTEFNIR
ncbi:MAG: HYR domain-containing protein, partial [Sneathiellales bacterium]|nr:HYR domain-containing protein [Sneathiellales bacterium]